MPFRRLAPRPATPNNAGSRLLRAEGARHLRCANQAGLAAGTTASRTTQITASQVTAS